MRALLHTRYGRYEDLHIGEVERPAPSADQVLVRVHASSANAGDWRRVKAAPAIVRAVEGLRRPKSPLFGGDAAGTVEEVGANVTHLAVGDEVFGIRTGSFAEYVAGQAFVRKPGNLTLEEAAALPIAGVTALQAVRDHGKVRPGNRVLVVGAGGGVGSMTVQIAKAYGAHVTAVTGRKTLDTVREVGADDVIDHGREDFTRRPDRFDAIVDLGGRQSIRAFRRLLRPGGTVVIAGAGHGSLGPMTRLFGGIVRRRLGQPVAMYIAKVERTDLDELRELAEAGKLRPVVEKVVRLEDAPSALRHIEEGHARGKVVIRIG